MKVNEILKKYQFHTKKKYGQNFLTSENVLKEITSKAGISKTTGVIEIGPGLGTLTNYLALAAKKVLCYEIDQELLPILEDTLHEHSNVIVLNMDILKANVQKDIETYLYDCDEIFVVANLPYYITTPILLNLLQNVSTINKYVVMMQLEVANRLAGKAKTKEYNSLSIAIQYRASVKKILNVSRNVFMPSPNVDSAVLELTVYDEVKYHPQNETFFFDLVRKAFAQRRKTLVNNLMVYGYDKSFFQEILKDLNFSISVRSEELSIEDFIKLSDFLCQKMA